MALINCPECNGKVSNKAPSCPHCGIVFGVVENSNEQNEGWQTIVEATRQLKHGEYEGCPVTITENGELNLSLNASPTRINVYFMHGTSYAEYCVATERLQTSMFEILGDSRQLHYLTELSELNTIQMNKRAFVQPGLYYLVIEFPKSFWTGGLGNAVTNVQVQLIARST